MSLLIYKTRWQTLLDHVLSHFGLETGTCRIVAVALSYIFYLHDMVKRINLSCLEFFVLELGTGAGQTYMDRRTNRQTDRQGCNS